MGLDSLGLTLAAIKTERLELAPLQIEDADVLVEVLADENLHEFVGGRPATIPELRRHYARLVSGSGRPDELWLNWVGRRLEDGAAVGTMQAGTEPTKSLLTSTRATRPPPAWPPERDSSQRKTSSRASGSGA